MAQGRGRSQTLDGAVSVSETLFSPSFQARFLFPFMLVTGALLAALGVWLALTGEVLGIALLVGSPLYVLVAFLSRRVQQRRLDAS